MSDLTPAAELRAAAAKLFAAATAAQEDVASNDYWSCYEPTTAWRDGLANGFGGTPGDLAGMCTPELVIALARWLETEAGVLDELRRVAPTYQLDPKQFQPLVIARAVTAPTEEPTP
jgi:hypothetical protein